MTRNNTESPAVRTVEGRICKAVGGFYYLQPAAGPLLECRARGAFRKEGVTPCVGDLAEAELTAGGKGYLVRVLPRKNALIRPPVANIDLLVLVVSTVSPAPNRFVLDKMLAVAEYKGIEPVLAVTKSDLRRDPELLAAARGSTGCGSSLPAGGWRSLPGTPAPARAACSTPWCRGWNWPPAPSAKSSAAGGTPPAMWSSSRSGAGIWRIRRGSPRWSWSGLP